jgi:predicted RNase H-like HicB family nuclease
LALHPEAGGLAMRKFAIIIEKGARNYAAYVPDLPVILVSGKTMQQVTRRAEKAIRLYIQELQREKRPIPNPRTRVKELAVA